MLNICIVCFEQIIQGNSNLICKNCLISFKKNDCNSVFKSIFLYEGEVRKLILRVKVNSDLRALKALISIFKSRLITQNECETVEYIVPAPSSLWGRLYGKIDIAAELAYELSKIYKLKLIKTPFKSYVEAKEASKKATAELKGLL